MMLLVVDDDPAFLLKFEEMFGRAEGVVFAGDAHQARELIGSIGAAFTAAVIDLDLPGRQDGFALIEDMHEHFPDLPTVAVSGVCQPHVLQIAMMMGATAALPKPIGPEWISTLARVRARAGSA